MNSHLATSWGDNWYKIDFYYFNTRIWSHLNEFNPYFLISDNFKVNPTQNYILSLINDVSFLNMHLKLETFFRKLLECGLESATDEYFATSLCLWVKLDRNRWCVACLPPSPWAYNLYLIFVKSVVNKRIYKNIASLYNLVKFSLLSIV